MLFSGCKLELENPNDLTLTLSAGRSITEGHAVIPNLTDANAVILKIRQYTNEVKTYKKEDLVISKDSITVPGGIKSGQGFDIELKLMNSVCTYIARAKAVTIEQYTNSVITLTVEDIKPHIILPGENLSGPPSKHTFFAVANPEKKDGLVFKNDGIWRQSSMCEILFDKYGRLLYLSYDGTPPGGMYIADYGSSLKMKLHDQTTSACIDTEENMLYYIDNKILTKQPVFWESFGEKMQGATFPSYMKEISVGNNYILTYNRTTTNFDTIHIFYCIDKFDINRVLKKFVITNESGGYMVRSDFIVDGDIAYVLLSSFGMSSTNWSKMQMYSLPDFKLLKTVTGFYGPKKILGKRDGKLYILDMYGNNSTKRRLGIYDILTGKLKFIHVKKFSDEIEFDWW